MVWFDHKFEERGRNSINSSLVLLIWIFTAKLYKQRDSQEDSILEDTVLNNI